MSIKWSQLLVCQKSSTRKPGGKVNVVFFGNWFDFVVMGAKLLIKLILSNAARYLLPVAVVGLVAWVGYTELFRPSRAGRDLAEAKETARQVQTDLIQIRRELADTRRVLTLAITRVDDVDGSLTQLADSVQRIQADYSYLVTPAKAKVAAPGPL